MAVIGIDLGTTNSLIAVLDGAQPQLIQNVLGARLTPSAVSIADDGSILVGAGARERLITHPDRTAVSFKRLMGSNQITKLGKQAFRPEELSSLVLRALKADAEAALGNAIEDAVISVPAYFNDHQRKATMDAGRLAGLKVERLVNEPTAAALAYGFGDVEEGSFLIFDLGGGTFDVSILEKIEGVMQIHATTGDTQLGGDDFTNVLQEMLCRAGKIEPASLTATDRARLAREAERLKLALTANPEASYALSLGNRTLEGGISRVAYEVECAPLLRRLRQPVERAVLDARIEAASFDAIVLVGGATRMPMIRSLVARLFGRLPLVTVDPDTIVALGAAVQSGLHQRASALKDVVMTDVCPYTMGVAAVMAEDQQLAVSPIIERNAVVPISRTGQFRTLADNQTRLAVEVYQGENLRPEGNIHLGTVEVEVPRNKAGTEAIDVRFTYDINGALQVEVTVVSTKQVRAKIFRNSMGLSEAELAKRFAALTDIKLLPREQQANATLIARAERLYAEHLGQERKMLRELIAQFTLDIEDQQKRDIESLRRDFAEALDRFERSPFTSQ